VPLSPNSIMWYRSKDSDTMSCHAAAWEGDCGGGLKMQDWTMTGEIARDGQCRKWHFQPRDFRSVARCRDMRHKLGGPHSLQVQ